MKVGELLAELLTLNPDLEVIMQKDSEGNGYSPLYCVDADAVYVADSTYSGDVFSTTWSADDCCMEDEEHKELLKQPRCVVLAPVN